MYKEKFADNDNSTIKKSWNDHIKKGYIQPLKSKLKN
jgi:hypothetical protein